MSITLQPVEGATRTRAVVVADLDGTISFDDRAPGPEVSALLCSLRDRPDVRLVLATARPPWAVRELVGGFTDEVDLICCNGALRIARGEGVSRTVLPEPLMREVLAELFVARDEFTIDYDDCFLASSPYALAWKGTADRVVLDRRGAVPGALKMSVAGGTDSSRLLPELLAGRAEVFRHDGTGDIDIVAAGVDKGSALDLLVGPTRPPVIALGNDVNDLGLLVHADHGIVVGSRLEHLESAVHVERVDAHDSAVASALGSVLRHVAD